MVTRIITILATIVLIGLILLYRPTVVSTQVVPPPLDVRHMDVSAPSLLEIEQAMDICGHKLSIARKQIIAEEIMLISNKFLKSRHHIEAFIGLLCIESKFDSNAKSVAGAIGIAQIMPKLAPYFAEQCQLGAIDATDLLDTATSLTVSACHFSKLLAAFDGNIALALAGYNSGQDSKTVQKLAKLIDGHPETMGYIAKFYSYINKLEISKSSK